MGPYFAFHPDNFFDFPCQHQFRRGSLIERHFGIVATIHQMPVYLPGVEPGTSLAQPGDHLLDQDGMSGRDIMERNGGHGIPFSIEKIQL